MVLPIPLLPHEHSLEVLKGRQDTKHMVAVEQLVPTQVEVGKAPQLRRLAYLLWQKSKATPGDIQCVKVLSDHL